MARLHAIIYVSSAVRLLEQGEIDHLLQRARERNAEAHVTGLLLYGDGNFMQYIEGPPESLKVIYEIILADPLHHQIHELMNESTNEREFSDWSMAFNQATMPKFIVRPQPDPAHKGQARQLLREVWATHGGRPGR